MDWDTTKTDAENFEAIRQENARLEQALATVRMQRDDLERNLINLAGFLRGIGSTAMVMDAYRTINNVSVWKTNHEPNNDLPF